MKDSHAVKVGAGGTANVQTGAVYWGSEEKNDEDHIGQTDIFS